jgi:hypothetical protein
MDSSRKAANREAMIQCIEQVNAAVQGYLARNMVRDAADKKEEELKTPEIVRIIDQLLDEETPPTSDNEDSDELEDPDDSDC